MTRNRVVRLEAVAAVARSRPSSGDTSRNNPVCTDRMATTSPSLGMKLFPTVLSPIEIAVNARRPAHAIAEATISFLDVDTPPDMEPVWLRRVGVMVLTYLRVLRTHLYYTAVYK